MYVIAVQDLLRLRTLEPHQTMVLKGLVREWEALMHGRVIFVSHEWLGWNHADQRGEQLATLQRVLERLCKGEVAKVEWEGKSFPQRCPHFFCLNLR